MKRWNKLLVIAAVVALVPITHAATEVNQATCPVMLGNPIDPSLYVDHEGQRIYFCCKICVKTFSENPQEYMPTLLSTLATEHDSHADGVAHDHETDHQESGGPARFVTYLGKLHPVAVHLPIALVLGAALAELLFMLTWNFLFRNAAVFNLLMAVLGAVATVPLGLAAASGSSYPAEYGQVLSFHKWLGIAVLLCTAVAAVLAVRANRKAAEKRDQWPYRLSLLTCVGLVGATGHFGGLLVYGLNHFSW